MCRSKKKPDNCVALDNLRSLFSNGCYRQHPVEGIIGETAGALAALCLEKNLSPRQVRNNAEHLADFQQMLVDTLGFVMEWPEYARRTPR